MSWSVCWSDGATAGLTRIPWREAARVDAAVQRYANTGVGTVVRLDNDATTTVRLRVPPYTVLLGLDPTDGVMHVRAVYRLR